MKTLITSTAARRLNLQKLQEVAKKLGIGINFQDFPKKKAHLLSDVLKELAERRDSNKKAQQEVSQEQQEILQSKCSKSEKMRQLHDAGMSTALIAKLTKSHYSFVYGVIQRHKSAEKTQDVPKETKTAVKDKKITKTQPIAIKKEDSQVPLNADDLAKELALKEMKEAGFL